ncbi:hypothetical protein Prudu_1234S000100 [Prunus dulcis]|uniref:Uncharacterized protein n=1 Tax=Prunus dulcis TaxID=3755 RepID=A0A5H2XPP0_PRUDU|nr:hypothetical protein Prudu_1234S000100 [Prunus dulcis]
METNYNLEDLDDESLEYVNKLFTERYKQWKIDLHHIDRTHPEFPETQDRSRGNSQHHPMSGSLLKLYPFSQKE